MSLNILTQSLSYYGALETSLQPFPAGSMDYWRNTVMYNDRLTGLLVARSFCSLQISLASFRCHYFCQQHGFSEKGGGSERKTRKQRKRKKPVIWTSLKKIDRKCIFYFCRDCEPYIPYNPYARLSPNIISIPEPANRFVYIALYVCNVQTLHPLPCLKRKKGKFRLSSSFHLSRGQHTSGFC